MLTTKPARNGIEGRIFQNIVFSWIEVFRSVCAYLFYFAHFQSALYLSFMIRKILVHRVFIAHTTPLPSYICSAWFNPLSLQLGIGYWRREKKTKVEESKAKGTGMVSEDIHQYDVDEQRDEDLVKVFQILPVPQINISTHSLCYPYSSPIFCPYTIPPIKTAETLQMHQLCAICLVLCLQHL